jgi:hypothetical protein
VDTGLAALPLPLVGFGFSIFGISLSVW